MEQIVIDKIRNYLLQEGSGVDETQANHEKIVIAWDEHYNGRVAKKIDYIIEHSQSNENLKMFKIDLCDFDRWLALEKILFGDDTSMSLTFEDALKIISILYDKYDIEILELERKEV